jgi:membrane protease subunit HflK
MNRKRIALVSIVLGTLLAILLLLAAGAVVVSPGEVAVVRRLGRSLPRPWTPGLHLGWPLGMDRITRVRTDEVRRVEVGLAEVAGPDDEPGAGEYLTGDLNLLRARGIVQYRVSDPAAFALRAAAVEPLLTRLTESSLARALARRGIDGVLRHERAEVVRETEADLAQAVERLGLGLAILGVSLTDARPPTEVAPDFAAAQAAQSEHDRRINEAKTYAATALPAAEAQALSRTEQARAKADRAVALARSRASRFLALLVEADRSRRLTVRRLYLDTLRDLLPRVQRKLVLTPEEPIDLSILGVGR